jgi:hypothetical protein
LPTLCTLSANDMTVDGGAHGLRLRNRQSRRSGDQGDKEGSEDSETHCWLKLGGGELVGDEKCGSGLAARRGLYMLVPRLLSRLSAGSTVMGHSASHAASMHPFAYEFDSELQNDNKRRFANACQSGANYLFFRDADSRKPGGRS